MFSKFSVKKPLTIFVGVVIAIVLGVVAFTKMTPDLLPNVNMPYAIVITAYPGATPEEVELKVSKPIEQAMATLDHIKEVTSTSRENSSQVMLSLTDDANMDTLTSEIREKLNAVSGGWDETVGTPYIMKINPNMLPVTVAAIDKKGMDNVALTNLLDTELMAKLEGIEGVASVSASGNVEENVNVTLKQSKIDALNQRMKDKLDDKFADAQTEMNEKSEQIDNGLAETREKGALLDSQQQQLEAGQGMLLEQTGEAKKELLAKKAEIEAAQAQIDTQLSLLAENLEPLLATKSQLEGVQSSLSGIQEKIASISTAIDTLQTISEGYTGLKDQQAGLEAQIAQLGEDDAEEAARLNQQLDAVNGQLASMEAALASYGITADQASGKIQELQAARTLAEQALTEAKAEISALGLDPDSIDTTLGEMTASVNKLQGSIDTLNQTKADLASGAITVDQAFGELSSQQENGMAQISSGLSQIMAGKSAISSAKSQLSDARTQLDSASADFEKQKETAYENSQIEVTMDMVSNILKAQNFSMPAGYVNEEGTQCLVRVGNEIEDLDEMGNLLLFDTGTEAIGKVYLKDVADVEKKTNAAEMYAKVNGADSVILSFTKQSTYSTAQVSKNILARFDELSEKNEGLSFTVLSDQGDYIYLVVDTVLQNLVLGALLAVVILIFFLKDIRPTLAIACSIPISLLVAIVLMYFSGVTLNVISLSGLAVGVGMLVDNSVVVIENIYRLRHEGYSAAKASVHGAVQVTGAIAASTLTTVCVFLPIVFVQGITRQLFTDMALTIAYSLLASLFVAITLVPAMTSTTLRKSQPKEHKWFDRFLNGYERVAMASLNHKWVVLTLSLVLLTASVGLSMQKGFIFMPSMSGTQLSVSVTLPDEEASFEEKTKMSDQVAQRIQKLGAVETVGAFAGSSGGMMSMGSSGDSISMYVIMKENAGVKDQELARQINDACSDLDCEVDAEGAMDMTSYMSSMNGSGIELKLYGEDMDQLIETAGQVAKLLEGVDGTAGVENGMEDSTPEYRVVVDKNKAMEQGLTTAQIYQYVSTAISASSKVSTMNVGGINEDVLVLNPKGDGLDKAYLKEFIIKMSDVKTGETKKIALSEVASFEERQSLNSIRRENQKRLITVSAGIADGYNVSLVTRDVEKVLKGYTPPEGILMETTGENTTIMDAMGQLVYMALLALLIIYLIMVIQFQSLLSPFIVMFTIPLAFTGGFAALYLCGMEVSVVSAIGFIMLAGIIVNNGIVLIDYINQLRLDGMPKREAILLAGRTMMRPILMTVLTTVLGLLFMAFATGLGAELMQPIAIVCIGGLLYATLMTLFVVPAMYDFLNRKELKRVDIES